MKTIWKLSKAKASTLAKREFGTAKGLEHQPGMPVGFFEMQMGNLLIEIRPWEGGCIIVRISRALDYHHIHAMFDGDTLEEVYAPLEAYQAELDSERLSRLASYPRAKEE